MTRRSPRPLTDGDLLTVAGLAVCLAILGLMLWMGTCRSAPAWGDIDDSDRFRCRLWPVDMYASACF